MFELNHYFTSFLTEMQTYLVELRQQTDDLHARAAVDEQARLLRQLGHTIGGLAKTVELPDFAGLGEALDETAARFLTAKVPLTAQLAQPMTRCADYFTRRLQTMATAGNFVAPTLGDLRDADAVAVALVAVAPALPPNVHVTGIHQPLADRDEEEAEDDTLSPQMQVAIAAFLRTHLRQHADGPATTGLPPTTPEVLGDFIIEMGDDLAQLNQRLMTMSATAPATADLRFLGEIAHKLKGAAAMIGMPLSATISEMFESLVIALRQKRVAAGSDVQHWLLDCIANLETLHTHITATTSEGNMQERLAQLQSAYTQFFTLSRSAPTRPRAHAPSATPRGNDDDVTQPHTAERYIVRIDVRRLDQLMSALNSFLLSRITSKKLFELAAANEEELPGVIARLIALSDRLRTERIETLHTPAATEGMRSPALPSISMRLAERRPEADDLGNSSGAVAPESSAEFDQLMTMVGETILDLRALHLALQTALNQIHRQSEHFDFLTESLQRDVLDLRLIPFGALAPRLDIVARSTALLSRKAVEFHIEGAEHEIDREITTAISEPLSQLLRNAIVHGIETPTERRDAGKHEPAQVIMRVATAGDAITIDISDNGRGINPHHVAAALLAKQDPRMTAARARTITLAEAIDLLLLPDVSTATTANPLAGSGTGLAFVKGMIESVHGNFRISSEPGVGTTFHIDLPVTLSILRALTVYADTNGYAIPVNDIRRVATVTPTMLRHTADGAYATLPTADGGATTLRVITLPDLLGHAEIPATGTTALIIAVGDTEYAIIVDRSGSERDIVVRKVPHHLHQRGVRGASISTGGEMLLILSLPDIVSKALAAGQLDERSPRVLPTANVTTQHDYILVVDDSPSIRRGLEQGLTQAGYVVKLARDGVEAIEQMTQRLPLLIILDIEMPNLNGYELLEVIRSNAAFTDMRVIMLTSQAGSLHRERALGLGAVGYLAKPVTTDELLAAVERALDPNAQTAYNQREETS